MNIQIEPVSVGFKIEADSIKITQGGYVLGSGNGAKCKVEFFSGVDKVCEQTIALPSSIIQPWVDDEPVIDYVVNELELVVVDPPTLP